MGSLPTGDRPGDGIRRAARPGAFACLVVEVGRGGVERAFGGVFCSLDRLR